jgi:hypothetical protein
LIGWAREERGEHFLKPGDQVIGFSRSFCQIFDLLVLHRNLSSKKDDIAFKRLNVARVRRFDRGWPRLDVVGRRTIMIHILAWFTRGCCRGQPRLVAARRRSKFLDLSDVPPDGCWRDEKAVAELGLLPNAIEVALGAISLKCSDYPGMTGALVKGSDLVDCKHVVVAAGRGRSRLIGGH